MQLYSIYNYGTRQYAYYEVPGPTPTHAPPPPARGTAEIGATPEQAAWRLPMGARKVGEGEMPRGRIASLGDEPAVIGGNYVRAFKLGAAAIVAYLAWKELS